MQPVLYFQTKSKTSAPKKLAGVRNIARSLGWHVQIIDGMPDRKGFLDLMDFWHPQGCIVECGGEYGEIDVTTFDGLPTVFFDRNPKTLPRGTFSVYHDSCATGAMAARELLLTGYRSFAYIHAPGTPFWSVDREQGFRQALQINHQTCATFICRASPRKMDLVEYQRQLCRFLAGIPTPAAIFAANDNTAMETINALGALSGEHAWNPADYALIGVDNFEDICEHTQPRLTSIEPDFLGGGETAALMLLSLIREGRNFRGERHRAFGPLRVVRRASCLVLRHNDPDVMAALDRITAEACQGLTAATVVGMFRCSRDMAEIRFRKATGMSILQAIHQVRLDHAKSLLRDSQIQLKAISDFCGFRNPNSLRKFFLKETGMTLTAWRMVNRRS